MTWTGDGGGPVSLDQRRPASPRSPKVIKAPLKEDIVVLDRVARIG
ncbi:MAG TPA: hypothetical protein VHY10_11385 [Xanthobacteraceae bacterium]|jgi:hypothetical protein|nr:hypothetical protein [Xanthobacteraceae bacterium]